jgi:riboflavin kinase/FMN adenylyltransferase
MPSAVALGSFDGIHIGHQAVISGVAAGKASGLMPTVFTFEESPLAQLNGKPAAELMTNEQKIKSMEALGIEQIYMLPFSMVMDLTAQEFVTEVLIKICRAKKVCCGFNFHFGHGGKADSITLQKLCATYDIEVRIVPAVVVGGEPVSSTRIRGLIAAGEVKKAAELLGRPFGFDFIVVRGRQLGRQLGAPTINQPFPQGFILPKFGVYASHVYVDGKQYYGVTNVGVKPTVGSDCTLAETWIPDFSGDLYDRKIQVDLLEFVRPEKKFHDLSELRAEIFRNKESAKNIASHK